MWLQRTEGAEFWLQVLTDLRQRGVNDLLVCCVDGPYLDLGDAAGVLRKGAFADLILLRATDLNMAPRSTFRTVRWCSAPSLRTSPPCSSTASRASATASSSDSIHDSSSPRPRP
jgi:hypothetical protein